jgi:hypothetical protein
MDSFVHCPYGFIAKDSWNLEPRFFLFLGGARRLDYFRLMSSQERIHPALRHFLIECVDQSWRISLRIVGGLFVISLVARQNVRFALGISASTARYLPRCFSSSYPFWSAALRGLWIVHN